jgi:hypothetical protein
MKPIHRFCCFAVICLVMNACTHSKKTTATPLYTYKIPSQSLYDTIAHMDSLLFDAYNNCRIDDFAAFISDSIEFYHDKGGLMTSKAAIIEATRKNICAKVRRELVKGSLEVYPIAGYGAVQIGLHRFHNLIEKSTSEPDRFIHTWQLKNGVWQLTRIISLH